MKTCAILLCLAYGVVALPYESRTESNDIISQRSVHHGVLEKLFPFAKISKTIQISGTNPTGLSCLACKTAVKALQFMINIGVHKQEIGNLGKNLCYRFHFAADEVCDGMISEFLDPVVYVFSKVSVSPVEICGSILAEDCGTSPDVTVNWTVALPSTPKPSPSPVPPPNVKNPKLKVLQISDIHFDPEYIEGGNADCKEPLCCRSTSGKPARPELAAGRWGDYRKCDTPAETLKNMLKRISTTHKVDYILWTGDDPPHNVWSQSKEGQISILKTVGSLLQTYFPNVPVFPALGNHEGIPVDSFPPREYNSVYSVDWLYNALSSTWTQWLPESASATIKEGGFYSVPVFNGFRIISLNMNACNNLNWWLYLNMTDPSSELKWLVNELENAEKNGEKVHIIGHIPPGSADCLPMWSYNYHRIVHRFESTIRGQFFGHTHFDEFEVFYDTNNESARRPFSVAYVAPSVTPYVSMNPSYRIYTVDGNYPTSSFAVLDHETYFFNLSEANLSGKPKWNLQYSAKNAYNLTALQPENWSKLVQRLVTDVKLFQLFYRHYHHASNSYPPYDAQSKKKILCRLQSGRSDFYSECLKLKLLALNY